MPSVQRELCPQTPQRPRGVPVELPPGRLLQVLLAPVVPVPAVPVPPVPPVGPAQAAPVLAVVPREV